MLKGIAFCHAKKVLHRDLKPQNILVDQKDNLKIADFGLARIACHPFRPFTRDIVTLWYRPPEILLGCDEYSTAVDMWAVGCIFAEMHISTPLFHGDCQIDQIFKIFQKLGTPNDTIWPGFTKFPYYKTSFPNFHCDHAMEYLKHKMGDLGFDLLKQMLKYNPGRRISAKKALEHSYFNDIKKK